MFDRQCVASSCANSRHSVSDGSMAATNLFDFSPRMAGGCIRLRGRASIRCCLRGGNVGCDFMAVISGTP